METSPHKDNTIDVLLTDHGFHLGEKYHWQKATLWEEATHCLLMIRTPGMTTAGDSSSRFVSLQDIYPKLVELCELDRPEHLDGRSLAPLLAHPDMKWESTATSCLCDKDKPTQGYVSIRNEVGRSIRYCAKQEEFYATTKAPHDWKNEIDNPDFAPAINKLRARMPSLSTMATPLPRVRK